MATINGIGVKAVKKFKDHEGATIVQGNVYYRNKKLGFWSQDSWGGPDYFDFDTTALNDEVRKYAKSVPLEKEGLREFVGLDMLLADAVLLSMLEKDYKQGVKQGYQTFISVHNGYCSTGYYSKLPKDVALASDYRKKFVKDFEASYGKFGGTFVTIEAFDSLKDFEKIYA